MSEPALILWEDAAGENSPLDANVWEEIQRVVRGAERRLRSEYPDVPCFQRITVMGCEKFGGSTLVYLCPEIPTTRGRKLKGDRVLLEESCIYGQLRQALLESGELTISLGR
ncbi:MAG: hypothetical protein KGJ34_02010 [Patescibacteria group bacterium]|nr:hypothetical protein [Patescibacteria group bacterium]